MAKLFWVLGDEPWVLDRWYPWKNDDTGSFDIGQTCVSMEDLMTDDKY